MIIEVEEDMATVRKSKKNKVILAVIIVLIIAVLATVIGVFAKNSTIEQVSLYTVGLIFLQTSFLITSYTF